MPRHPCPDCCVKRWCAPVYPLPCLPTPPPSSCQQWPSCIITQRSRAWQRSAGRHDCAPRAARRRRWRWQRWPRPSPSLRETR
eukprot:364644-Chlamydomonas_euryale.AAC.12